MIDPDRNPGFCRVMVLFPNWLGDAVMAASLLEILDHNRDLPDGRRLHLTLGIRRPWSPLFLNDPRCDDFLLLDREGRHAGVGGLLRLRQDLIQGAFDAVVLGPPSLRVALASALARVPIRVGYAGDGRSPLLTCSLTNHPRGTHHYCREMHDLGLAVLEQITNQVMTGLPFSPPSLPGCADIPAADGDPATRRIVLAPGATYGQAKTWPLTQALDFCRQALAAGDLELVLLGDSSAATFAADLAQGLHLAAFREPEGRPGLVDLTGGTTLTEVVALLKSSTAFVGNDSGLMHLAAALQVPTLGIFGSSNPDWTAPVGPRALAVAAEGFPCRPCYRKTCNQPQFCLETISGTRVLDDLTTLLATAPESEGTVS